MVAKPRTLRDSLVSILLFTTILIGYLLSGNRSAFDSALYLQTSMSIVREGNTNLDEYPEIVAKMWWPPDKIDGHLYDTAPIGTPVLMTPIVFTVDRLSALLGLGDFNEYLKHNIPEDLQSVIASLIMALTAVLIYHVGRRSLSRPAAALLTLIFAFGTTAWSVVSRTLWQHGPSMLMLTIALWLALSARDKPQRIQYVGLVIALAYVIRPTNSIAVVAFTAFVLLRYRRYFLRYLLWAAAVAIPFVWYSWSVYHALLPVYYRAYTGLSFAIFPEALIGQLVSPARGLLIFSPVLVFSFAGIILKVKRRQWQAHDNLLIGILTLHWILISLWWNWWAGVSFGPRIWSDMLPYLIYFVVPALAAMSSLRGARRAAVMTIGAMTIIFSLFVHYRGANAAEVMDWNAQPAPIDVYHERVWDWRDPQWLRGLYWGTSTDLVVSGIQPYQLLDSDLYARLGTNAVRARQFDVTRSLIAPQFSAWVAIASEQAIPKNFTALFEDVPVIAQGTAIVEQRPYRLYHFDLGARLIAAAQHIDQRGYTSSIAFPAPDAARPLDLPVKFGETADLIGFQVMTHSTSIEVMTIWRAGDHIVVPLQVFVHAIRPDGSIAAQEDRLDVPSEGWRPGDVIVQVNRLDYQYDAPVWIELGLYNLYTGERVPVMTNGQIMDNRLMLSLVSSR